MLSFFGFFVFARRALGRVGGFVCGVLYYSCCVALGSPYIASWVPGEAGGRMRSSGVRYKFWCGFWCVCVLSRLRVCGRWRVPRGCLPSVAYREPPWNMAVMVACSPGLAFFGGDVGGS